MDLDETSLVSDMAERVITRIGCADNTESKYIEELVKTIKDRVWLRLGLDANSTKEDWGIIVYEKYISDSSSRFHASQLYDKLSAVDRKLSEADRKRAEMIKRFESIIVDAAVKLYRRNEYEGISSESDEGLTVSFVDDCLAEYSDEFDAFHKLEESIKSLVVEIDAPKLTFL